MKLLQHHAGNPAGLGPAVSGDVPQVGGREWKGSRSDHRRGLQEQQLNPRGRRSTDVMDLLWSYTRI